MADRVICMMLGSPLTECSVHLFKQSIQSCTLPSARKPVYRALCIVSLKHSAEYSVWSIQSAYYNLPILQNKFYRVKDLNNKLITFQLQNTESHIWFEKVDILQMFSLIPLQRLDFNCSFHISIDFLFFLIQVVKY